MIVTDYTQDETFGDAIYGDFEELDLLADYDNQLLEFDLESDSERASVSIEANCGDDLIFVSSTPLGCLLKLDAIRSLGMKISEIDTSINTSCGNYTESILQVPRTYYDTWLSCRKLSYRSNLGYIDIPKLRFNTFVTSMRQKFSDTVLGKVSGLGTNIAFVDSKSPLYGIFQISGLYQDISLSLIKAKYAAYLPVSFSGMGKPPPFKSDRNFVNFFNKFHNGTYKLLISSLISETLQYCDALKDWDLDPNLNPPIPGELLQFATLSDPVFTDWVKGSSEYTKLAEVKIPPELEVYKIGEISPLEVARPAFSRLLREGKIVSETKLKIAIDHNYRTSALLDAENFLSSLEALEDSKESWRKVNICSVEGLTLHAVLQPRPTTQLMSKMFHSAMETFRDLRAMIKTESVYDPEALHNVYVRGPMLTPRSIYIEPNIEKVDGFSTIFSYVPDYPEDIDFRSNLEELLEWALNPIGTVPTSLIEDDGVILNRVSGNTIIITDDIQMCRKISTRKKVQIFRVPVEFYYRITYFGSGEIPYPPRVSSWPVIEDTGSIQSGEEKYFFNGMFYPEGVQQSAAVLARKRNVSWDFRLGRELDFSEVEVPPFGWPNKYLFNECFLLKRRKKRKPHHLRQEYRT